MITMDSKAAAAQERAWKVRRFGLAEVQRQEREDEDAAARLAKAQQYTREAPARWLSAEINRNQLQLERMLEAQRLSDIRMQLQTEKSDWNPGEPYKPVVGDTPESIQKKAELALKTFQDTGGQLDRTAQAVLVGFMQANPCDLTNVAVWESAWSYICSRLQPKPAEVGIEPEKSATVVPEPEEKNPFRWDDNPRSDYAKFERERYKQSWQGELDIWRSAIDSLNISLSSQDVRSSYERFISYTQELAKSTGQPRQAFNVENATAFLKAFFAGRMTNAPEMTKAEDAESSESLKQRTGFVSTYDPAYYAARRV